MRETAFAVLVAGALTSTAASGQPVSPTDQMCGTPSPTAEQARAFLQAVERRPPAAKAITERVFIPVAFHVIHDGRNGKIARQSVEVLIHNLNWGFRNSPFSFFLYKLDSTKNKAWYGSCAFLSKNEAAMKKKLAVDTRYVLNIYSCQPGGNTGGYATFPPQPALGVLAPPNGDKRQGVVLHPGVLPGGTWNGSSWPYGLPGVHEAGHYLGAFHTFESLFNPGQQACTDPGDLVDDTPSQAFPHHFCPDQIDTCPALPGADDVRNFMNYTDSDLCMDHFTQGQVEWMMAAVEEARPTLLP